MYFIYNGVSYQYEGQPSDNYYDFELNPLISNPCDDILEKSRLLYGLREKILYSDEQELKKIGSLGLIQELKMHFNQITDDSLTYWALLDYLTLAELDTCFSKCKFNAKTNELTLSNSSITLVLDFPIVHLMGIDSNGEACEIDENNFKQFNELKYSDDSIDPELFMSDEQLEKNHHSLNVIFNEIITIFTKYGHYTRSCEDIFKIYNLI
jgi:hypothetical protein